MTIDARKTPGGHSSQIGKPQESIRIHSTQGHRDVILRNSNDLLPDEVRLYTATAQLTGEQDYPLFP